MVAIPSFYIDNVRLLFAAGDVRYTYNLRGNTVSDCRGSDVIGIEIKDCRNVRAKDNKVLRMRTQSPSTGFKIQNCVDVVMLYSVASRCDIGFDFEDITTLNVYNLTSHNCNIHVLTDSTGVFRNVALTAYDDHTTYMNCTGFLASPGATINVDYMMYSGISTLYNGGSQTQGTSVEETQVLYMDEPNDDLTPDHISELVNSGTANPIRTSDPCIGGIESEITSEVTADREYQYNLLDNSFWDIDNLASVEMSLIRAFQSRILANNELATYKMREDLYIKGAHSVQRFSELYPMYARYANPTKFKKRVMDMWYAGQNPATLVAYNNAIGGYNLYPSFFKRMEDVDDAWIIAHSYIDIDNWLLGMEDQKYGIVIDVLGLSTLSQSASAECYNNTQKSVSDIAPVRWALHHEAQPDNYMLFTDLYNGFESCVLSNMVYNDDFNIHVDVVGTDAMLTTPLISTLSVTASGGEVELSTLDRLYSENITRRMYYRQGNSSSSMSAWTEITFYYKLAVYPI
jgi:hypothetical protein